MLFRSCVGCVVECDASIIDGSNMHYGGVGAVSGIKNPIALANLICKNQNLKMSFGRIPPWYIIIDEVDNIIF